MNSILDTDSVETQALEITEKILEKVMEKTNISKTNFMDVRQYTFPKILKYLLSESYSFSTSKKVIHLLSDVKNKNEKLQTNYDFSQKDMNDCFENYKDSEEFQGIASKLHYGWSGSYSNKYRRSPDKEMTARVLFIYTSQIAQGIRPTHISLVRSTMGDGERSAKINNENDVILLYHANRLFEILKSQGNSYITRENIKIEPNMEPGKNKEILKETENGGKNESDKQKNILQAFSYIDELIENAYEYRKTIFDSFNDIEHEESIQLKNETNELDDNKTSNSLKIEMKRT